MHKKHKKVIVMVLVIVAGFLSGYFSGPAEHFISNLEFPEFKLSKISWFSEERKSNKENRQDASDSLTAAVEGAITGDAAVNSVKALPAVKQIISSAASQGCQVIFRADQPPTEEYPVWLVELRQIYPNQIPDILFIKVDSFSGKVLDIQTEELQIAGFKLSSPLPSGSGAGRLQYKNIYNKSLKRNVRIEKYKGFEVESDRKNKEVIRITVTKDEVQGPRGLVVGAEVGDVIKKFGKANIAQEDLLIFNALDNKHIQLHIKIIGEKVSSFSMFKIFE